MVSAFLFTHNPNIPVLQEDQLCGQHLPSGFATIYLPLAKKVGLLVDLFCFVLVELRGATTQGTISQECQSTAMGTLIPVHTEQLDGP